MVLSATRSSRAVSPIFGSFLAELVVPDHVQVLVWRWLLREASLLEFSGWLDVPAMMLAVQQHPAAYIYWQGVGHLSFSAAAAAQVAPVCPHWHNLAATPDTPSCAHAHLSTSSGALATLFNTAVAPLAPPSLPQPSAIHVELELPIGYGSFGVVWYVESGSRPTRD